MPASGELSLYHLTRGNGDPLFVHPFTQSGSTFKLLDAAKVLGEYGQEPRVESLTMFRNQMYRRIEEDVRAWIAEKRFLPRFLAAAGVFLITYLLFSLVVRDPIPMVDELLLALAASLGTYVLLGRRDLRSEEASKRRIALRNKVDGAVFTESEFLKEIEETVQRYDNAPREELVERLNSAKAEPFWSEHGEEANRFFEVLQPFIRNKRVEQLEKRVSKGKGLGSLADPRRFSELDLPLFLLYIELKQELASV
ncbi:MAG: hypothetical protein ACLFPW_13860 [Spirochaetaceae bacterium]